MTLPWPAELLWPFLVPLAWAAPLWALLRGLRDVQA